MKFFLILLIQLISVAVQAQQDELIDQVSYNLKGSIKSITQLVSEAKEGNGTIKATKIIIGHALEVNDEDLTFENFQLLFNKQGKLIQKTIFKDSVEIDKTCALLGKQIGVIRHSLGIIFH